MRTYLLHNVLAIAAGLLIGAGIILLLLAQGEEDTNTSLAWLLIGLGIGAVVGALATRRR